VSVVVIGDVMLDVFEEGKVERISPEAPVPVLANPRGYQVLGGAANTARNVHALGPGASLIGLIGDDTAGARCRELITEDGMTDALVRIPDWGTVVKHRFIAGGQQVLRVDSEHPTPEGAADALLQPIADLVPQATAVVLSDYAKGAITDSVAANAIKLANAAGIPVAVDSKRLDPAVFRGCSVMAPNHLEATRMTGTADPQLAAERIAAVTDSAVIVTLGPDGMMVFDHGRSEHIHSQAHEVADVTGAGDSVTAALIVGLLEGQSIFDAARFASAVAAIAVEHTGTYAVTRDDLR
jgi:D-beta-D-heptose 7-phosphate kinase/D-beta-D-heptose 1-phosphate adenosyltransferase